MEKSNSSIFASKRYIGRRRKIHPEIGGLSICLYSDSGHNYSDHYSCLFFILENSGKNYSVKLYRSSSPLLGGISAVFCMCLDQPVYVKVGL